MIRMMTAYSVEVFDKEQAVRDILGQLPPGSYSAQSVGLLFCNFEFVESGIVEAVCAALPFEIVGCTTQGVAVRGAMGHLMLSLTVLSGPDAVFSTALSEPLGDNPEERIRTAYANAAAKLGADPSMIFALQPYLQNIRGDTVLRALASASGGVPVLGAIALDFTTKFRCPRTILNGQAYADRLPLLLAGGIKPKFFMESLPKERAVLRQHDVITEAHDNILISVNNMPAVAYLETLGLASNGAFNGSQLALPVLIHHRDGSKVQACCFYEITPEGFVHCGSEMPVGAVFSIASLGHADVISSVYKVMNDMRACSYDEPGGVILFSCFSRNIVLAERSAEMEAVRAGMCNSFLPCSFMYSGGVLCPSYTGSGKMMNRFCNYSLVGCLL